MVELIKIPSSEAAKTERDAAKMVSNATTLATHVAESSERRGGERNETDENVGLITNTYVLVRQGKKSRKEAWGRGVPQCVLSYGTI